MAYGFPVGIEDAHLKSVVEGWIFVGGMCSEDVVLDSIWVRCGNCGSNGCF